MEYLILGGVVVAVVRIRGRHGRRARVLSSSLRDAGIGMQPRYKPAAFAWYPRRGRR